MQDNRVDRNGNLCTVHISTFLYSHAVNISAIIFSIFLDLIRIDTNVVHFVSGWNDVASVSR